MLQKNAFEVFVLNFQIEIISGRRTIWISSSNKETSNVATSRRVDRILDSLVAEELCFLGALRFFEMKYYIPEKEARPAEKYMSRVKACLSSVTVLLSVKFVKMHLAVLLLCVENSAREA